MNLSFHSPARHFSSRAWALLLMAFVGSKSASAATFTVTTPADTDNAISGCATGGACSLREAIKASNAATGGINTINFASHNFATRRTISLKHGDLPPITSNLILNGPTAPGAGVTLTEVTSELNYGLVVQSGNVKISALNITGFSGALFARGGHTLVQGCTFYNNTYAIGVYSKRPGTLTAQNCTLSNNTVGVDSTNSPSDRIGLYSPTSLQSCTIVNNVLGIANTDKVYVSNSIVGANESQDITNPVNDAGNNLLGGAQNQLGLANGLQDNGGPTFTIALLNTSPAINLGSTPLANDQRSVARDSQPDIGAFEYVNAAPKVVEVTPQGASDRVGTKRIFTLTVSDDNRISDIASFGLLINDELNLDSGAYIVFDPKTERLSLRQGDHFLPPIHIGASATDRDVLDNGAVRIDGREVTLTRGFEDDYFALSIPATIESGLIGKNTLFARVKDSTGAVDSAAKPNDGGFVRSGSYTVLPRLSNSAPTLSKLAPRVTATTLGALGIAEDAQKFGFFAQDKDGAGDIREMWLMAGKQRGWKNSATFVYYPRTHRLVLRSDDGQSWMGGGVIGSTGILENSQVRVDLAQVKLATYADGRTLGLILPLQAKNGLLGQNNVWLRVRDSSGATSPGSDDQGFILSGSWIVAPPSSPADSQLSAGTS